MTGEGIRSILPVFPAVRETLPMTIALDECEPERAAADRRHHSPDLRVLSALRRAAWFRWLGDAARAAALALAIVGSIVLVVIAIDLATPLSEAGLRIVANLAIWAIAGSLLAAIGSVWRRRRDLRTIAARLESLHPALESRLYHCLDLQPSPSAPPRTDPFARRLFAETDALLVGIRPQSVIEIAAIRRALGMLGAVLWLAAIGGFCYGDRARVTIARLANPGAEIPPLGSVRYHIEHCPQHVLRGDSARIVVKIDTGEPTKLVLHGRTVAGGEAFLARLAKSTRDARQYEVAIAPRTDVIFRIAGSGTWTPERTLVVVDPPRLRSLRARLHPPDYLPHDPIDVREPTALPIVAVRGSRLELEIDVQDSASQDAAASGAATWQSSSIATPLVHRPPSHWHVLLPLAASDTLAIGLVHAHGFVHPPLARLQVQVTSDEPPRITIARPSRNVRLSAASAIAIECLATDDYGLDRVRLEVGLAAEGPFAPAGSRVLATSPREKSPRIAELMLPLDVPRFIHAPGARLWYRAVARDRAGSETTTAIQSLALAQTGEDYDDELAARRVEREQEIARLLAELARGESQLAAELAALARDVQAIPLAYRTAADAQSANRQLADEALPILERLAAAAERSPTQPAVLVQEIAAIASALDDARDRLLTLEAQLALRASGKPSAAPAVLARSAAAVAIELVALSRRWQAVIHARERWSADPAAAVAELEQTQRGERGLSAAETLDQLATRMQSLDEDLARLAPEHAAQGDPADPAARAPRDEPSPAPSSELATRARHALEEADRLLADQAARARRRARSTAASPPGSSPDSMDGADGKNDGDDEPEDGDGSDPLATAKPGAASKPVAADDGGAARAAEMAADIANARAAAAERMSSLELMHAALEKPLSMLAPETLTELDPAAAEACRNEALEELDALLATESLADLLRMAERATKMDQAAMPGEGSAPSSQSPTGDVATSAAARSSGPATWRRPVDVSESIWNELDPDEQRLILSLPPEVRGDLIAGLRRQAPPGYEALVRRYFERLAAPRSKSPAGRDRAAP